MSDGDRFHEILDRALELPYEQAREHLLTRTADDPVLRQRLLTELEYEQSVGFHPDSDGAPQGDAEASRLSSEPASPEIPARVGRYEVLEALGKGGMGTVFRARHLFLDHVVALKFYRQLREGDDRTLERARREGRIVAGLSHPNITRVHDLDDQSFEMPFLVMDYVAGETLESALKKGPLPKVTALRFGAAVADAIHLAHEQKVIHRDLSCANLMVTPEGEIRVLDFGIAHQNGDSGISRQLGVLQGSRTTEFVGTPGYVAPERVTGGPITEKVDVWALGAVIYKCLTGRDAFPLGPPLSEDDADGRPPTLSGELGQVLDSCWRLDPAARPSARQVRDLLRRILRPRWPRHLAIAITAIASVAVAVFTLWAMSPRSAGWKNGELVLETGVPGYSPAFSEALAPPESFLGKLPWTKFTYVLPNSHGFFRQTLTTTGGYFGNNSQLRLVDWRGRSSQVIEGSQVPPDTRMPPDMNWRCFDVYSHPDGGSIIMAPCRSIQTPLTIYHSFVHRDGSLERRGSLGHLGHLEDFPNLDLDGDGVDEQFALGWNHSLPGCGTDDAQGGRSVLYAIDPEQIAAQAPVARLDDLLTLDSTEALDMGLVLAVSFPLDCFNPHNSSRCVSVRWGEPGQLLVGVFGYDPGRSVEYRLRVEEGRVVACTGLIFTDSYRTWILQEGHSPESIGQERDRLVRAVGQLTSDGWVSVRYMPSADGS